MTEYQKNRLQVYTAKIEKIEKNSGFIKKNFIKVLLFGIGFSLLLPFYSGPNNKYSNSKRDTLLEISELDYLPFVIITFLVYAFLCFLGHIIFSYQDKRELKKLRKLKASIEYDIKKGTNSIF